MRKLTVFAILFFVGALSGCAVVPVSPPVGVMQPAVEDPFDYVGYTTPLAVAAYPGVPFYPRYVQECLCIYPVAFVGGYWINYQGARVVYRGHWNAPPPHVRNAYTRDFRANVNRAYSRGAPVRGRFDGPASRPHRYVAPLPRPQPRVQSHPQARPQPQARSHTQSAPQRRAPARRSSRGDNR